jgi:hypothetical protein
MIHGFNLISHLFENLPFFPTPKGGKHAVVFVTELGQRVPQPFRMNICKNKVIIPKVFILTIIVSTTCFPGLCQWKNMGVSSTILSCHRSSRNVVNMGSLPEADRWQRGSEE